ncbi:MAG: hypothetical protein Q8O49_00345 [bacterium]|nr:hypothetical protein [bacterium]
MGINQEGIRLVTEAEVDHSFWKIFLLGFLTVLGFFGAIFGWHKFWATFDYSWLALAGLGVLVFLVAAVLDVFFIKSFMKVAFIGFIASFMPLVALPLTAFSISAIGAAAFLALFLLASKRAFDIANNSIRIKFFLITDTLLNKTVTGLMLFWSVIFLFYYFNFTDFEFDQKINQQIINQALLASQPIVKIFSPNFSPYQKAATVIEEFAKDQAGRLVPKFDLQLPGVKEKIIKEVAGQFEQNLKNIFPAVNFQDSIQGNFYRLVESKINNLADNRKLMVAIGLAMFLFLITRGLAFILLWFFSLSSFIVYKFLLLVGFAQVNLETRSREYISLP